MKICITGDSWGVGEWGHDETGVHRLLHGGISEYLTSDGHEVVNVSEGGGSNNISYRRLRELDLNQFDLIFFFQTDPFRDYDDEEYKWMLRTVDSIKTANTNGLRNLYQKLNSLNQKIYMIGGCHKVDTSLISQYDNLTVFIPAVIEFLYPKLETPQIWLSSWIKFVNKHNCNKEAFDFIYEQKMIQDKLFDTDDYWIDYYFNPDCRHANRKGHYKIYEKINKDLIQKD